ncbi:MAG: sensor histidine kinase [Actinomycetota bacterium]
MSRRRASLAARIFLALAAVVLVGSLTLVLVTVSVGPGIFQTHLRRAGEPIPPGSLQHLQEAFARATLLSLGVAVAASLLAAGGLSWFVTRRLVRPVAQLAVAAQRIAAGSYDVRVPDPRLGGEFDALVGAFRDMAAALLATEQTRRRLLADLAHELRTPLATAEAYVEGLADGVVPPEPATWATLREQLSRLQRLTEDVGLVSRAQERRLALRRTPVAPRALVDAAVAAAAPRYAAAGVDLAAATDPDLPDVLVDPARIGEVLGILLDNAARHTPRGGRVTVTAHDRDGRVALAVQDTGSGIPAEHLERVFERFYRVQPARDRASGGSGIGLTIARALVEAHGGTLTAASAGPGTGATFTVTLPG